MSGIAWGHNQILHGVLGICAAFDYQFMTKIFQGSLLGSLICCNVRLSKRFLKGLSERRDGKSPEMLYSRKSTVHSTVTLNTSSSVTHDFVTVMRGNVPFTPVNMTAKHFNCVRPRLYGHVELYSDMYFDLVLTFL